jgi:hypothetical protein
MYEVKIMKYFIVFRVEELTGLGKIQRENRG